MSTRMDGIYQPSLFSSKSLRMDVIVPKGSRYRLLAEKLPWPKLAGVANHYRSQKIDIDNGRPLDLRLHLGAMIAQSMNRWTDRETEDMVGYHAGVRLLCGLELSSDTIDHTSIEEFRSQVGREGVESLNRIIVQTAKAAGFTDGKLCSSDTTVQEAPIAYPTEVGHMKKIGEKLVGIGTRIRKGLASKLGKLAELARKVFTEIRLFTRGKGEQAIERKKKLARKLQQAVAKMERLVRAEVGRLGKTSAGKYEESLDLYRKMLSQIRHWHRTGFHPKVKIVSLWARDARAILRNKAGKMTEFGRRWLITRLSGGYVIGAPCERLGSGSDATLMPEVLSHFERTMGELPKLAVFDRGGDGVRNHRTLRDHGITNGIFRKGKDALPGVGRNTTLKVRRERALSEATIATLKHSRYGFNKPRARSSETIILKGHAAIFGANLAHLTRDWTMTGAARA